MECGVSLEGCEEGSVLAAVWKNEDFSDGTGDDTITKFKTQAASRDDVKFDGASTPCAPSDCGF
jgi:hypothetical protein